MLKSMEISFTDLAPLHLDNFLVEAEGDSYTIGHPANADISLNLVDLNDLVRGGRCP